MSLISTLIDMRADTRRVARGFTLSPVLLVLPGVGISVAVALAGVSLQAAEGALFHHVWLESLVLAILVGAGLRTLWTPSQRWRPGISFSAKVVLELAVVMLGASVSLGVMLALGWAFLLGTFVLVALAIGFSFGVGRLFGLPTRMALLVACGTSICGNSAIAAVAPVIGAKGEDVAASVAFTALLGVLTVLGLPLIGHAMGMNALQFGVLSGLTVYAVPQVLAAAAPMGAAAIHIGTFVKLLRVLMLGPVCFAVALLAPRLKGEPGAEPCAVRKISLSNLVPWFILGFVGLMLLRSVGAIPQAALPALNRASVVFTVVSMGALGLCTDLRAVARSGPRVAGAVTLSLLGLGALSLGLIGLLHIG